MAKKAAAADAPPPEAAAQEDGPKKLMLIGNTRSARAIIKLLRKQFDEDALTIVDEDKLMDTEDPYDRFHFGADGHMIEKKHEQSIATALATENPAVAVFLNPNLGFTRQVQMQANRFAQDSTDHILELAAKGIKDPDDKKKKLKFTGATKLVFQGWLTETSGVDDIIESLHARGAEIFDDNNPPTMAAAITEIIRHGKSTAKTRVASISA